MRPVAGSASCARSKGRDPVPRWVLDACVDTAPFGDLDRWAHPPTSGTIADGWLHGRGAADSKVGVAIFCHVAARLADDGDRERMKGSLVVLLDADEHTGRFGGARAYFDHDNHPRPVGGVMIGYPGFDKLVVGSSGVFRAEMRVHGVAAHSGSRHASPNAVVKAAALVNLLDGVDLPADGGGDFPMRPQLTVTRIGGGHGYSIVPDLCVLNLDIRTTPAFDAQAADSLLRTVAADLDRRWAGTPATEILTDTNWPPYVLDRYQVLRTTLVETATALGHQVEPKISGPSSIGNYLAGLGVPATAGFGVAYKSLHATDERIDLTTIPLVEATYLGTTRCLLGL